LALILATIIFSLTAAMGGIVFGLHWGTIALIVIANATILQSSYVIAGLSAALLSEPRRPRGAPRRSLRPHLVRAAQFAIGEELRTHFQTPSHLPRLLRIRMEKLAAR
jgi:hypothetical protein